MLLITFHGGKGGVNNVYGYSTQDGKLETKKALHGIPGKVTLDELRAIAVYGGNLYVVNGSKDNSYVLVFKGPPKPGPEFDYLDTVIGYGQSIMHPFGITFDPDSTTCYVSNQDSNVVAKVALTISQSGVSGALGSGCQSNYLTGLYPAPDQFLDGTFAASQNGNLDKVQVVAPNVSAGNGGLGVKGTGSPLQPGNSVRGVAIANSILFVCDEVGFRITMYSLDGGDYLGASPSDSFNKKEPTHLSIYDGGIWVSADDDLYWSALPASTSRASLSFQKIAIKVPAKNKIGSISFDDSGNVYVVFQDGTGGTGKGSIEKFSVTAGTPPTLSGHSTFAKLKDDTPEFCLWVSDSKWPE